MPSHRNLDRRSFIAATAGAAGAATMSAIPARLFAQSLTMLNIASFTSESGMQCRYAMDEGYFKKHGLDATVTPMSSGTAMIPAVLSGGVDIGISNPGSIAAAYAKGLPVVLIAPGSVFETKRPTTALLVAGTSAIKTAKDLEGKTVAVNGLHDLIMFSTVSWIEKNGGDSSKVNFVEVSNTEMPIAVQRGTVAGAVIAEPSLSYGKSPTFGLRVLGVPYDAVNDKKRFLVTAWFTTTTWIKAHPDAARAYVAAISDVTQWANANQAASATLLEKYVKLSPEAIAMMQRSEFSRTLSVGEIQPVLDLAYKSKLYPTPIAAGAIMANL